METSGYALAESANLLMIPGRVCSSGKLAPVGNVDWAKFVAGHDVYREKTDAQGGVVARCTQ